MAKSLYILDGHYQIYRAFYAPFGELNSPSGEPTRATHVFCSMLFGLIRDRKPDYLIMTLDAGDETTFRRELDPQYKAHREPAPEALHLQADRIRSIVEAMGVPTYVVRGFEADDLMATIAERLKGEDIEVFLVSRDKDLEQLLSDRVRLFDIANDEVIDPAALMEKKGYTPQQAVEVQTLAGDSTDNIPGVEGVGVKTAAKLIREYGSAEAVIQNADRLTPAMGQRVKAFIPLLPLTRQLVTLRRDAPIEIDLSGAAVDRLNFAAARTIFDELGMARLKEQLDRLAGDTLASTTPSVSPAPATRSERRGTYHLVDTPEAYADFVQQLKKQRVFAVDTETTGLNPVAADLVGIALSWKSGEAYYLPVRAAIGKVLPLTEVAAALQPILEDPAIGKVGQNLKYDMVVLRQVGIEIRGLVFDTMIASFLLDPLARSHGIDALSKKYFDYDKIPTSDLIGKGRNQITMDQVPTSRVCEYSCEDADFTWRLYELLDQQITGNPVEALFRETEVPLVEVLVEMEHNGINLNVGLLKKLGLTMDARVEELTRQVYQAAGRSFNLDSTKQLASVLFDEQGLQVVRHTKTGRSTDAETLEMLIAQTENPIPRLVLEYRELAKLKSTYVETLPKMVCRRTGRIHASFDQTGAVTGRLSSSDPNLQNIPVRTEMGREIRRAFIAGDADHLLLSADYSQIELRLLAHFSQDEALLKAFHTGQDIHRTVAAQVNGVPLDQVTPTQRSAAKAVNFGIIYGQSAFGLGRSLGISNTEAKTFIDTYFRRYPGIRAFIDRCVADARKLGYAETMLGRRRPVPELQSRNRQEVAFGERIAVNTVVQGSAADLIKRAMIDVHRAYKSGGHAARMLIQVHDELVFEVPKTSLETATVFIRDRMENAVKLNVPIVVDVTWGPSWAEAK